MRIVVLIRRIMLDVFREKRTLALLFIAPLFILTLMHFLFNGETKDPIVGVVDVDSEIVSLIEENDIVTQKLKETGDHKELIIKHELDGLIEMKDGEFLLKLENDDPPSAKALQMKMHQVIVPYIQTKVLSEQGINIQNLSEDPFQTAYVYGDSETGYFDVLGPILVGFFAFFFTFLISGIGLLKERTTGTLERLLATPIKRGEIVIAYIGGYGVFAIIQTIIIVFYAVYVLDVVMVGSIWLVLLINIILALVALSLGTLLSSFAASEFQMIQFIPIIIVPQVFFSGIIPIDGMATWLQWIAKIMPLYYAADGLKQVMYQGLGLIDIQIDLIILCLFASAFIILNMFALKKHNAL